MTYRLLITQRAAADLEEAYRWYAERSPEGAVRWYNGFLDALDTLAANPERCPLAPEDSKFPIEVRQLLYGRRRSYRALFTPWLHKRTVGRTSKSVFFRVTLGLAGIRTFHPR